MPSKITNRTGHEIQRSELILSLKQTKSGKSTGFNGVCSEFIKHLEPKAMSYLLRIYNIIESGNIPIDWFRDMKVCT